MYHIYSADSRGSGDLLSQRHSFVDVYQQSTERRRIRHEQTLSSVFYPILFLDFTGVLCAEQSPASDDVSHAYDVLLQTKGVPLFPCLDCSCVFKKLGSLNAHISKKHISVIDVPSSTSVSPTYSSMEQKHQHTSDSVSRVSSARGR